MQEAMLEHVKAGTYLLFDGDEYTRHRMNLSFLKMGGLPEHEGRANLGDCTLISRFSARKGAGQIMLKTPISRTDDPSSQHSLISNITRSIISRSIFLLCLDNSR